uniref:DNA-directed RNA polymerase subunit beta n=1 Tax=Prasiola crispa TaxID=173492 RepID=A0A0R8RX01_PRACR|nr:beta subunit of RNA polymerase [Prasiola crispa]
MLLSSYRIPFLIPYFVEMQRKSFLNFLNTGLNYEITKKNPMYVCFKQFKITFYPEAYKLSIPEYTSKTAILKFQTYSSKLYIPVEFTNFTTKELKLQWILLGTLPLMTKRGHFIVNGCPRVIVNQIVRSPGIYYKIISDEKKRKSYYGDLISQRGAWLRLEIDKKKRVWVKIKKSRKIPILIFFKALGISDVKLEQSTKYTNFLEISKQETESIESTDYFHPSSVEDSLIWIYGFVYPEKKEKGQITLKKAKKFLLQKFFSHSTYDLGDSGRNQLNQKFNLKVSKNILVLTPHDLLCAMDYLIKLEQGIGVTDDIDDLKNRRVRTSGELLQNQIGTGFIRLEKFIKNKTENPTFNVSKIFSSKPVDGALREFFGSSPLSQFMDQTNPLAELTHKRRISSLGPGGVSRETAGMQVRGIHASHYGRICPIETPEGRNAGLVNSLTTLARINKQGFIETPFYNVYQGQIQKFGSTALLSATHESQISIAASDLQTNYFYFLPYVNIPARAYGEFQTLGTHKIQYMSVSPIQMISIATSLIPFLEHDDANRALMGSNMQRQAVPLILPERPVVGTGLETRIVSDSGHGIQANTSGIVVYTSSKNIRIKSLFSLESCSSVESLKNFSQVQASRPRSQETLKKTKFLFSQQLNPSLGEAAKILKTPFYVSRKVKLNNFHRFYQVANLPNLIPRDLRKTTQFLDNLQDLKLFESTSYKAPSKQKRNIKNIWVGFTKSNQVKNVVTKNVLDVSNFNKNPTHLENLNFMPCIKSQLIDSQTNGFLLQSKQTLNFFVQNNVLLEKQTLGQTNQHKPKFYTKHKISPEKSFVFKTKSKTKIGLSNTVTLDFDYFFLGFNCINFINTFENSYQSKRPDLNNRNCGFKSKAKNIFYNENFKKISFLNLRQAQQKRKLSKASFSPEVNVDSRPVQFREIYIAKTHFLSLPLRSKIKINTLQLIAIQTDLNLKTNKVYFINSIPYTKNICDMLQMFYIFNKIIPKKPAQLRKKSQKIHWLCKKQNWTSIQPDLIQKNYSGSKFYAGHNIKIHRNVKKKLEFSRTNFSQTLTYTYKKKSSNNFIENTSDFIKGFLKECIELVFTQVFVKKKNLKHIFFFTSVHWENFQNQKSLPIRFSKKTFSSNFFKVSRFTGTLLKKNSILKKKTASKKYYNKNIIKTYSLPYSPDIQNIIFLNKKLKNDFIFQNKIKKSKFYEAGLAKEGLVSKNLRKLFNKVSENYQTKNRMMVFLRKRNKVSSVKFIFGYTTFKTIQTYYYLKNLHIKSSYLYKKNSLYGDKDLYHSISSDILPNVLTKEKLFLKNLPETRGQKKTISQKGLAKQSSFSKHPKSFLSRPIFTSLIYKSKKNYLYYFPFSNRLCPAKQLLAGMEQPVVKFVDAKNSSIYSEVYKTLGLNTLDFGKKNSDLDLKNLKQQEYKIKLFSTQQKFLFTQQKTKYFSIPLFQTNVCPSSISTMEYKLETKSQIPSLFINGKNLKFLRSKSGGFFHTTQALLTLAEKKKNIHTINLTNINLPKKKIQKKDTVNQSLKNKRKNCLPKLVSSSKLIHSSLNLFDSWGKVSPTFKTQNYTLGPYQHSNQNTCLHQVPLVSDGEWIQKGDLITDGSASVGGELALGKSISVAYMPWEGYNFEDAILVSERLIYDDLYTSIHIEKYTTEISDTQYGREQITASINVPVKQLFNLDKDGIVKFGTWVNQGDILVGKLTPIRERKLSGHEKLLSDVLGMKKNVSVVKDTSLRVPKYISGRVVHIERLENENISSNNLSITPSRVHIYIAEKKKVQVGDKMSGRHGNKGIISKILPRQDMPYLADGTPIDMVLNPLGVPSRMNVGQIFECLLGLAAKELNQQFKISCFDEMNGAEASRSFTYSKLFEARVKTGKRWLFHPDSPGKMKLFDGRTGECFHQNVTVGKPYMLKLIHLVDEKIHARSTGPYSLVTQQPVRGRSKQGGQRLGEMEVWALEGFGAAYTLQELLTMKSDDIEARHQVIQAILERKSIAIGTPESFKVLLLELQSLCLHIGVYSISNTGNRQRINSNYLF